MITGSCAVARVGEQRHAAQQAEPPERDRDHRVALPLRGDPLHQEPRGEDRLASEADDQPELRPATSSSLKPPGRRRDGPGAVVDAEDRAGGPAGAESATRRRPPRSGSAGASARPRRTGRRSPGATGSRGCSATSPCGRGRCVTGTWTIRHPSRSSSGPKKRWTPWNIGSRRATSRGKIRTEQPVSRIDWPSTALRTRLAHRLMTRFDQTSSRLLRQPSAASWPGRAVPEAARSAGLFCRSASRVATQSPRAARKPAAVAADWPTLLASVERTQLGVVRPRVCRRTAGVSSVEPSSTITISNPSSRGPARRLAARAARRPRRSRRPVAAGSPPRSWPGRRPRAHPDSRRPSLARRTNPRPPGRPGPLGRILPHRRHGMASLPSEPSRSDANETLPGLDPPRIVHTMPSASIPKPTGRTDLGSPSPVPRETLLDRPEVPLLACRRSSKDRPTRSPGLTPCAAEDKDASPCRRPLDSPRHRDPPDRRRAPSPEPLQPGDLRRPRRARSTTSSRASASTGVLVPLVVVRG